MDRATDYCARLAANVAASADARRPPAASSPLRMMALAVALTIVAIERALDRLELR